jgi:hypothetical protein
VKEEDCVGVQSEEVMSQPWLHLLQVSRLQNEFSFGRLFYGICCHFYDDFD